MKRWIVLAENGGHTEASKGTSPEEGFLLRAADGLSAMGLGGWLVTQEAEGTSVRTSCIMRIGNPRARFEDALVEMAEIRAARQRRAERTDPPDVPAVRP